MRRCKASQAMRPVSKLWAVRKSWETASGRAGEPAVGESVRASESLDDAPQDPRLPCYPPGGPTDRLRDLYGSLSRTFGISGAYTGRRSWSKSLSRGAAESFSDTTGSATGQSMAMSASFQSTESSLPGS